MKLRRLARVSQIDQNLRQEVAKGRLRREDASVCIISLQHRKTFRVSNSQNAQIMAMMMFFGMHTASPTAFHEMPEWATLLSDRVRRSAAACSTLVKPRRARSGRGGKRKKTAGSREESKASEREQ